MRTIIIKTTHVDSAIYPTTWWVVALDQSRERDMQNVADGTGETEDAAIGDAMRAICQSDRGLVGVVAIIIQRRNA